VGGGSLGILNRRRLIATGTATALCLLFWAGVARADFTVLNTDDDGTGSLRDAIEGANANMGADVVDATGVGGTINLASALPDLSDDVTINGPGAGVLTVRRDTGGDYRIFTVSSGVTAEISGLTIADGSVADQGGGISNAGTLTVGESVVTGNNSADDGGGIFNDINATLSVLDSTVGENSANGENGIGGGILNFGTATITRSTVARNLAANVGGGGSGGGGIASFADMTIANSTIARNITGARGGGIVNNGDGTQLTITNTTIAGNTAAEGSGSNVFQGSSGNTLPLLMTSTLLAQPLAFTATTAGLSAREPLGGGGPSNCNSGGGNEFDSQGYNLDDDGTCELNEASDQPNVDAQLGPLADNGGPTETMLPAPASRAVDQGLSDGLTTDQRGLGRPHDFVEVPDAPGGDAADIGAVELQEDEFDFEAPETTITKHPKRKLPTDKRRVRVKFRFEGTDDFSAPEALTFECKLDHKSVRSCASPFKKRVKPGKHRFRVWAIDEVGNVDETPARFRFKVKSQD
jgi:hypothetical protein